MNHKDIINLWPSAPQMAADLTKASGTKYFSSSILMWKFRERIPCEHWHNVVKAAKKAKIKVNFEDLAEWVSV